MGWLILVAFLATVYFVTTYPWVGGAIVGGTVALIAWRRRRKATAARALQARLFTFDPTRRSTVEVVGESSHQGTLTELAGGRTADGPINADHIAILVREPTNRYDPNAIQVTIGGRPVGYLSREDAVAYGPVLDALANLGRLAAPAAHIKGGWAREGGRHASFGVVLHMGSPDELLAEVATKSPEETP